MNGNFPLTLWSHFDHDEPRTTNLAEGWHNSLNITLAVSHPTMRSFLDWLQKCQHVVQSRGMHPEVVRKFRERPTDDLTTESGKQRGHSVLGWARAAFYIGANSASHRGPLSQKNCGPLRLSLLT